MSIKKPLTIEELMKPLIWPAVEANDEARADYLFASINELPMASQFAAVKLAVRLRNELTKTKAYKKWALANSREILAIDEEQRKAASLWNEAIDIVIEAIINKK